MNDSKTNNTMNLRKIGLYILCLTIGIVSCKKDDAPGNVVIELRDRTEQQIADMDSLNNYLETHYYNSDELAAISDPGIKDLVFTKLLNGESVPVGYTLLKDATGLEKKSVRFADTDYEFYVLTINQGGGNDTPTFADNVRVLYEGFTLNDAVFDNAVNPVTFDLTSLIPGWRKVLPQLFYTAESFVDNNDGTVNYINRGVGVMFLPSGLAYFSNATPGISSYSSIIFKFELLKMSQNDHDRDGIPSYLEDLNGDGEFTVNFTNLKDTTDDDTDGDGDPTNDDTDGDGTPNYADSDDDGDGILTINEDINNDGDPTNDDSNGNGIPNYLDATDKIKKS